MTADLNFHLARGNSAGFPMSWNEIMQSARMNDSRPHFRSPARSEATANDRGVPLGLLGPLIGRKKTPRYSLEDFRPMRMRGNLSIAQEQFQARHPYGWHLLARTDGVRGGARGRW